MSQTKSLSHTCSTLRQQRTKQCLYNVKCDTGHLSRPVWTAELNTKINIVLLLTSKARSNVRKKLDTCTHYMIHLCLLYKQVRLSQCQRSGQRSWVLTRGQREGCCMVITIYFSIWAVVRWTCVSGRNPQGCTCLCMPVLYFCHTHTGWGIRRH